MDSKIFLSLLLYKDIVSDKDSIQRHLHYRVLGPMMGTIEKDVFMNTSDKKYFSIEKSFTNMNNYIRYAYYDSISLKEAKKKYHTNSIEKIVEYFYNEHKKDTYYVICVEDKEPIIIKYDEEKMKRRMDSNLVEPL